MQFDTYRENYHRIVIRITEYIMISNNIKDKLLCIQSPRAVIVKNKEFRNSDEPLMKCSKNTTVRIIDKIVINSNKNNQHKKGIQKLIIFRRCNVFYKITLNYNRLIN